jgi:hypothetical protein
LAGPGGWRAEDAKGAIASCTKFVALVDESWLSSFRCLQVFDEPLSFPST